MNRLPDMYEGDLPYAVFARIRGTQLAWDIETLPSDPPTPDGALDWKMGKVALTTIYAPERNVLACVRHAPQFKTPGWVKALLFDASTDKIFHHAMFDNRFMARSWDVRPANISCTKIAAKLLGVPHGEQSLNKLVHSRLGLTMTKGYALSDWGAATLSEAQLRYAAEDVLPLPALHQQLRDELRAAGKEKIYDEVCAFLPTQVWLEVAGIEPATLFQY